MQREYVIWDSDKIMGFVRVRDGLYESDPLHGVTYQLERRKANTLDECPSTGFYLYSVGADDGFFGEWCAHKIRAAVNVAVGKIFSTDLRTPE